VASIPLDVLLKIEAQRPELAPCIHDLMATDDPAMQAFLEKRLATAYFTGVTNLTPEETLYLSACCAGRNYADVDKASLH
jgi:hypothetical protein